MTVDLTRLLAEAFPVQYPVIEIETDLAIRPEGHEPGIVDRVQVRFGPDRFAMLIRHTEHHHWCGYTKIDEAEWYRIEQHARKFVTPKVSFVGYSGKIITWMTRTVRGRLSIPAQISADNPDGDFWIGFDTARASWFQGDMIGHGDVYNLLLAFDQTIWRIRNGDLGLGG